MALGLTIPMTLQVGETQTDGCRYSILTCEMTKDCPLNLCVRVTGQQAEVFSRVAYTKGMLRSSKPDDSAPRQAKIHIFFNGATPLPERVHISFYCGTTLYVSAFVDVQEKIPSPVRQQPSPSLYCHRKLVDMVSA